ncbi:MAG TPA: 3-oxoacyl-[acyl-carrier-protein] synthase III C-terminal domain-containing protein [Candidatus Binatia bacterium]|nr:3-oxoacyl-[acyl-carrier-protein] synthase III C-terminal domain-containing protein [Candidatus Binatia bacterium]
MTRIAAVEVDAPAYVLTAERAAAELAPFLPERASTRLARLIEESRIATRHLVAPIPELARPRTVQERTDALVEHAVPLATSVARRALESARMSPAQVDAIVCVTSTSFVVPSLDAQIARDLGLPPSCRRVPINQLGCSGGVAGIGLAADLVADRDDRTVLVVAVEVPSLSLPTQEPSLTDLAACCLLGDGAGAAVVTGCGDPSESGFDVLATRTLLFPEVREGGGARLTEGGFRMVSAVGLPRVARARLRPSVAEFLAPLGLALEDISLWAINPRSPQILEAIGDALDLSADDLAPSWTAWSRYGNTISATVYFILDTLRTEVRPPAGALGILLSFGAGVTCEMALVRWR